MNSFMFSSSLRFRIFFLLFASSFLQVAIRVCAMALLALTGWYWAAAFMFADYGQFLLYKLLRRDLYYWVPGYGPIMSLMVRIVMKTLVDCTGCIHFRHPLEMGGAYFCWNMLLCFISCFAAAGIYAAYYDGEPKLDTKVLFTAISTVTAAWLLTSSALLLSIDRGYVRTFLSKQSGREYAIRCFTQEPDDECRIRIFAWNEHLWEPVRRDVKKWVKEKYSVWRADSAPWLTDEVVACIPDEFMPTAALAVLNASGRRSIRKPSILPAPAGTPGLLIGPLQTEQSIADIHIGPVGTLSAPATLPPAPTASGPPEGASADTVEQSLLPFPPDAAQAAEDASTAPQPKNVQLYMCDYQCGFAGSFQLVAQHEVTCAKRTDAVISFVDAERLIGALRVPSQ
jgi:hypothetical protein